MKCYLVSGSSKRICRRRTHDIWQNIGIFQITEQRLASQVKSHQKQLVAVESGDGRNQEKQTENNNGIDIDQPPMRDADEDGYRPVLQN